MCGIIGGICKNNITPLLINGLKRLEYRGYDSAGLVVLTDDNALQRVRATGKVINLEASVNTDTVNGTVGIAHTRWATHGKPTTKNAHPHICNDSVGVVHNGIIENFLELKAKQQAQGYHFTSDTDTEVIAHGIHQTLQHSNTLLTAVQKAVKTFQGAYGIGVISPKHPGHVVVARSGSPLVIGVGKWGNFIASDQIALLEVTKQFIFLEEGDIADITENSITIFDKNGQQIKREIKTSTLQPGQISKGNYAHYMQKEIFEQPQAITDTLESRITKDKVLISAFGHNAQTIFQTIKHIQIIACGTSYNAGLVAKYWLEDIAKIPTHIEVASEYRYRNPIILDNTLFITISQSGETADTLEALKSIKKRNQNIHSLTICNSAESSLTRESELTFLTHAGVEIGVASTKAFTTQLVSLALLSVAIGKCHHQVSPQREKAIVEGLTRLPGLIAQALDQENQIIHLAKTFKHKFNALFLGRGAMHAIAMEGA
ncbi:MAG: glutamine--fructose-6-phosphate transaminase (isomerizing), partial [Gammaproteobacteria bacterium]|nr:glutamine--fructose-6-phosphate transaminase (isomerizing) [Gammaproteobacteria bacterium]